MELNPKTTKNRLILSVFLLTYFSTIAAPYLLQSANAAPRRPLLSDRVYYRAAPPWQNHVPYELGDSDYGISQQFVLPEGAVTSPAGRGGNGG
jgi:hypothetical protein